MEVLGKFCDYLLLYSFILDAFDNTPSHMEQLRMKDIKIKTYKKVT